MKRTYRIDITFEAEFERKIGSRSWAKKIQEAAAKIAPPGWSVTGARVRSRAIPKPAAPAPADPQETVREQTLALLQDIATRAARYVNAAPNPRVRVWPNRQCGPQFNERHGHGAHAHIASGTLWFGGKKIRKTRGLICVTKAELDRVAAGWENPEWLMIHEVAHLRYRTGHDHTGRRYQESFERLERDYLLNEVN
jgi:hypothetical protein